MTVDAMTLAVVKAGLEQIADEMDTAVTLTAFSTVISEGLDRASGMYDAVTGEVIVQGDTGLPNFIGTMHFTVGTVARTMKDLGPGDVIIVNDPYAGGSHVMDVKLVAPIFVDGGLFCFLANTGHWLDMGGAVPGGFGPSLTEVYQEGLRIRPLKLYCRGKLNQDLVHLILDNIRIPDERYGDLMAQVNALHVGRERLEKLIARFGRTVVEQCIRVLRERAEQQMRSHIAEIPDGVYCFEDHLDSDGVVDRPLRIHLELTVAGSDITFDFSRSDPPCRGPLNSALGTTKSACLIAFKHVFPDVLVNAGSFEPFCFIVPETTFLNATFPRPVSGCAAEVSQRVVDTIFGALAQAMPERMMAAPAGTSTNLIVAGEDPKRGRYVMYAYGGGGYGGFRGGDGLTHGAATIGSARIPSMEAYEQNFPIRVRCYAVREGSAGAGASRGGFGVVYEYELLRGEAIISYLGDRGRFRPFGILGGTPAAHTEITIERAGGRYVSPHLTKDDRVAIAAGDVIRICTPGGGGFGDPLQRDPALVLRDVRGGYITPEHALSDYGVVIDEAATTAQRTDRDTR